MPRATPKGELDDLAGWVVEAAAENEQWSDKRFAAWYGMWYPGDVRLIDIVLFALRGEWVEGET